MPMTLARGPLFGTFTPPASMFPLYDRNPTRKKPVVTRALIVANVVVYLLTAWLESQGVNWVASGYGMVASRITADPSGEAIKMLSSQFLHGGFMHLAWNMLFLHIFGDNVEDALGRVPFLLFYLAAGIAGCAAQYASDPQSTIALVGASGAIAGVLGAYLVLYPRAPITVFNVFIIPLPILVLPAWFVVGWWFITNLLGSLASLGGSETSIAYLAHLGGFALGILSVRSLVRADVETQNEWSGLKPPPRVATKRIFPRDQKGPFWRE